jgi:hypothetical protein
LRNMTTLSTLTCRNSTMLNKIFLPWYRNGSHEISWENLTQGCASTGSVTIASAYMTLTGTKPSGWTVSYW